MHSDPNLERNESAWNCAADSVNPRGGRRTSREAVCPTTLGSPRQVRAQEARTGAVLAIIWRFPRVSRAFPEIACQAISGSLPQGRAEERREGRGQQSSGAPRGSRSMCEVVCPSRSRLTISSSSVRKVCGDGLTIQWRSRGSCRKCVRKACGRRANDSVAPCRKKSDTT